MSGKAVALRLKGVEKSFGDPPTRVLQGISLDIRGGEFVSLLGRSGSGKSTLLYIMSTLDSPTRGEVVVNGRSVTQMSSPELHDFRNRHVGFVFQFHYLLPELTALENVLMPALKRNLRQERLARAKELLRAFGLEDKEGRFPSQLSGGEQQRVAIARALVMEPQFLFADEPTGNLDSSNGDAVMQLLKEINHSKGTTVVYVTHDPDYAQMASRQIRLIDGQVAAESK